MATSNAKSDYLEQKIIEAVLKNTSFAGGATLYVGLATAVSSGETPSVTEVTGGSYARVSIASNTSAGWTANGQVGGAYEYQNQAVITFPTATADWGTVSHWLLYDASTSGNLLYYCALDVSKSVLNGDTPSFAAGTLKISES